ncbi:hypothetical protein [uncultured Clostridium sp.]|jgi:hypothetical protein|uniref:hypothetical protein n=1 Tax=uncultured Clostridium sp. TaxID=59620 RepID=UPI0025F21164|nr:hypothetical protein [uncultured Clostridium sp.]
MIKKITSFTSHTTAEGERVSYTYSEIDDNGTLVTSNKRATCIILDVGIKECINKINTFLLNRENKAN